MVVINSIVDISSLSSFPVIAMYGCKFVNRRARVFLNIRYTWISILMQVQY